MKKILSLIIYLYSLNLFPSNYEVEFFFTSDDRDFDVMKFTDEITLRQFKAKANCGMNYILCKILVRS